MAKKYNTVPKAVIHDGLETSYGNDTTKVTKPVLTSTGPSSEKYYADADGMTVAAGAQKKPTLKEQISATSTVPTSSPVTSRTESGGSSGGSGGYSAPTVSVNYSPFQQSDAVTQALAMTNNLLAQLTSGKTSYSDQIAALLQEYQSRDPFAYNPDEDMMFQNALASAMRSGQTAMMDTMGQAAALTGGYGSTYSQSVGNQAYNQYIQGAYDTLPEFYQMSLDAYNREGDAMMNKIGLLSDADAAEYERLYTAYTQNYNQAMDLYNREFSEWSNAQAQALNEAELAYKYAALAQDRAQYNSDLEWAKEQYQMELDAAKNQVMDPELAYKYAALAQDKEQFDAEMAYKNSKVENEDYDDPTPEMMEEARKAYKKKGEQGLYDYVYKYPGYNIEAMLDYAYMIDK